MDKSATQRAIDLVDQGETPYQAAKALGIAPSTLYVALKRRRDLEGKGRKFCPCCSQVLRAGFTADPGAIAKTERDRIVSALRAKGDLEASCEDIADAIERMGRKQ